jgi:hypothetical protein
MNMNKIMSGKNKKGAEYYYIVLSLILGLMVFAVFLFWIYEEYFTEEEADIQICRQSVQIRANIPDITMKGPTATDLAAAGAGTVVAGPVGGIIGYESFSSGGTEYTVKSFKQEFPLKCKTQVVTIDYEDQARFEKEIANTIAGCWSLFGEGKSNIFPANSIAGDVFFFRSTCVPCARIHVSPKVRDYYLERNSSEYANRVDILRGLKQPFRDTDYLGYLTQGDGPFSAFSPGNALAFEFSGSRFDVDWDENRKPVVFVNRLTKGQDGGSVWNPRMAQVSLPRFYDPDKGDLLIYYGALGTATNDGAGHYYPYMFYTHSQNNYIRELGENFVWDNTKWGVMCDAFEGIPA